MSIAKTGENHPMLSRIGENHPSYGRLHSEETKLRISKAFYRRKSPSRDAKQNSFSRGLSKNKLILV
jgi:hypothetical protein